MDKNGEIKPGVTPDVDDVLAGRKEASEEEQAKRLQPDMTSRLAEVVTRGCGCGSRGCRGAR